jgi:hypothetical protein
LFEKAIEELLRTDESAANSKANQMINHGFDRSVLHIGAPHNDPKLATCWRMSERRWMQLFAVADVSEIGGQIDIEAGMSRR